MGATLGNEGPDHKFKLRWTLRQKVGALAAVLLFLLMGAGAFLFVELTGIYHEIEKITSADIPLRKTAHDIHTFQFEQHLLIRRALSAAVTEKESPASISAQVIPDFENHARRITEAVEYGKQVVSLITVKDSAYGTFHLLLDHIHQEHQAFEQEGREAIRFALVGNLSDAEEHYQLAVRQANEVYEEGKQLLSQVERFTEETAKSARKRQIAAIEMGFALGSLIIFVGALFFLLVVRKWAKSIADLSERAKMIASTVARGIPSAQKLVIRSHDEIGDLCHAFNRMTGELIRTMKERKRAQDELWTAHDELEKRIEERTRELKLANEQLKELDELKSNFVSLSWHELKSPLVSIQGYVSLVLRGKSGPINERQKRFLEYVQKKAEQLKQLINRLLNLSKIEVQYKGMKLEPTDLKPILERGIVNFKPRAQVKEITMELVIDGNLKCVSCDAEMVEGMIDNLLSNALKFTPRKGRIQVSAGNTKQGIHIDIEDTGIGMKEEALTKIFEPFQCLRQAGTEGEEGTGLGLSLVKKIVEAHKGMIQVTSREGCGSRFTVFLPASGRLFGIRDNRSADLMRVGV